MGILGVMKMSNQSGKGLMVDNSPAILQKANSKQQEKMFGLSSKLIVPAFSMSDDEKDFNDKAVIEIYTEYMLYRKKVPTFSDVFDAVCSHNQDIFDELAMCECEIRAEELGFYGSVDEDDEMVQIISSEWEEMYYTNYTFGAGLDYFVQDILDRYKIGYTFDSSDMIYADTNAAMLIRRMPKAIDYHSNDCQNIINPEMLSYGFCGNGDYLNYYKEHTSEQLMLGCELNRQRLV